MLRTSPSVARRYRDGVVDWVSQYPTRGEALPLWSRPARPARPSSASSGGVMLIERSPGAASKHGRPMAGTCPGRTAANEDAVASEADRYRYFSRGVFQLGGHRKPRRPREAIG